MKILINATPLFSPRSGVGRYTRALGETLLRIDPHNEYHFFAPPRFSRQLPQFAWETASAPTYSYLRRQIRSLRNYSLWVDWGRRWMFDLGGRARQYTLYHEPNSVPLGYPAPVVLTVLDLSIRQYPETHPKVRVDIFNRYFYQSLQRVSRIITISQAIKQELIDLLSLPADRIDVVHLAADPHFGPLPSAQVQSFLQQRGLPSAYLLYVGTLEPRKNLLRLIEAYAALPYALRQQHALVLAGFKGWPNDESPYRQLAARVEELGLTSQVIFTGFVPEADLPLLYNGARAFVFPSIYEGFGLPPLEALQTGLPVLISTAPALVEVMGEAGLAIPSTDTPAWTAALHQILTDGTLRQDLSQRGRQRARQFSWETCARQTLATYQRALAAA